MFTQIRRHQKWLWIFISGAVIISFVWYFNPRSQRGAGSVFSRDENGIVGTMDGKPVHRNDYLQAFREAQLSYFLNYGEWPQNDDMMRRLGNPVERQARQRLVLIKRLQDYNIKVNDEAVANWIADVFQDRETKTFRPEFYDRLLKEQLGPHGVRKSEFENYVRHQVGISHLAEVAGSAGLLVPPTEAEMLYKQENEKAVGKVVLFSTSNYLAQVKVNPADLAKYYTNNASRYRIQERAQLSYVGFPASNYFAQADQKIASDTNFAARVDELYLRRGTNFYTGPDGKPLPPEAAKQKIKDEARKELALIEAQKVANAFMEKLFKRMEEASKQAATNKMVLTQQLEQLAAAEGLPTQMTEPFTQFEGPKILNLPDKSSRQVFQLNPENPITEEPIKGEDAVYVVSFKNRFPSEVPPMESLGGKVEEDYKREEAQRLAREAANAFIEMAKKAVAEGKKFDEVATGSGYQVVSLAPFSQTTRAIPELENRVDPTGLKNVAFSLKPGGISNYMPARDGGYVLHLENFIPVPETEVKTQLASFTDNLRRNRARQAFDEWFQRQLQIANLQLAGDKPGPGPIEEAD